MKPLGEKDRQALRMLLADDDEQVQALLREQFLRMGADGREFLETAARDSTQAAGRAAARILHDVREHEAREELLAFCRGSRGDLDLEQANWLLARSRYPALDVTPYRNRLDQMAQELRERLTGRETPRATIEVCNHYLFQMLGFRGNQQDYYDPDNSYLHRVLDRRLGIPISLSVLYLLIGKRLGLPLFGVNLPGHFILTWRSPDVAFFLDPFNGGQLLDAADCRRISERLGGGFDETSLMPVSPKKIFLRQCRNLQAIYRARDARRGEQFNPIIAALTAA
jgi:Uncharacterized conserved protein